MDPDATAADGADPDAAADRPPTDSTVPDAADPDAGDPLLADGLPCDSPGQCASGFCSNRLCCASACDPALVLHWRLDDPDGDIALDTSGNGRSGTYVGNNGTRPRASPEAAPVTFTNPSSRLIDGGNRQAVTLANMPLALRPATQLTLSAWFRATALDPATGSGEVITGGNNYLLRVRATEVEISKRAARAGFNQHVRCYVPTTSHLNGNWHHIAAVIDATTVRLYYDGVLGCALADADPMAYDLGTDLWVGRHPTSTDYDWNGHLDDIRIYTRPLTSPEITTLAQKR